MQLASATDALLTIKLVSDPVVAEECAAVTSVLVEWRPGFVRFFHVNASGQEQEFRRVDLSADAAYVESLGGQQLRGASVVIGCSPNTG
ncbi:MAG: hypothetical protein ABI821_02705 [Pseudomonadota bacterium]